MPDLLLQLLAEVVECFCSGGTWDWDGALPIQSMELLSNQPRHTVLVQVVTSMTHISVLTGWSRVLVVSVRQTHVHTHTHTKYTCIHYS